MRAQNSQCPSLCVAGYCVALKAVSASCTVLKMQRLDNTALTITAAATEPGVKGPSYGVERRRRRGRISEAGVGNTSSFLFYHFGITAAYSLCLLLNPVNLSTSDQTSVNMSTHTERHLSTLLKEKREKERGSLRIDPLIERRCDR